MNSYRIEYRTGFNDGSWSDLQVVDIESTTWDAAVYTFQRIFNRCFGDTIPYAIDGVSLIR